MSELSRLFEAEMKPSLGCTEPAAVGYATSLAYHALWGRVPDWLQDRRATSAIQVRFMAACRRLRFTGTPNVSRTDSVPPSANVTTNRWFAL